MADKTSGSEAPKTEELAAVFSIDLTYLIVGGVIILIIGGILGIGWHWLIAARNERSPSERRPIYWNLIFFAAIGAVFSILAMLLVTQNDRTGIALLFLGLIGGYAASIKELDLAKVELDKLRLEKAINNNGDDSEQGEDDDNDGRRTE